MDTKRKSILNIPIPKKKLITNNINKLQSNGLTLNRINSPPANIQAINSKSVSSSVNFNVPKIKESQSRNNNSSYKANKNSFVKTCSNSLRSQDTISKNIHSMKSSNSFKNNQIEQKSKENTNKLKNLIFSPSFNKIIDKTMTEILIKSKETNNISLYSEKSETNNIMNVNGMIISNFINSSDKNEQYSEPIISLGHEDNNLIKTTDKKEEQVLIDKVDVNLDERINYHRFFNNKRTNSVHESTFSLIEDNISSEIYLRNRSKSKDNEEIKEGNQKDDNVIIKVNKKQSITKKTSRRCNKLGVINEEEEPMSIKNCQRSLFPFETDKISPFNIKLVNNNLNRLKNESKSDTTTSITDENLLSSTDGMTERNSNRDTITITNLSEFDNDNKVINSLKKPKEVLLCRKGRDSKSTIRPFEPIVKISNKNVNKKLEEEESKCNIF